LIKRLFKTTPVVAALVAVGLFATAGSAGAAQTTSQLIVSGGSDTTYFMANALGTLYSQAPGCNALASTQPLDGSCPNSASENKADSENYFHDYTADRFPLGSSAGVNGICKKGVAGVARVDYARSSRVPLGAAAGGSDCSGLRFIGYARDALTWECFPGTANPCHNLTTGTNSLTQAQLKDIFVNCAITNWNQIGGTAGGIHVYVPQANSGTGISWAAYLGVQLTSGQALTQCVANPANPGQPGSNVSPENTNSLILTNGDQANAIFPWSVGVFHHVYGANAFTSSDGGSLGKINGVQATDPNILSGAFPASRYVFNVYCKGDPTKANKCGTSTPASPWVTAFMGEAGFICKNEAKHNDHLGHAILNPQTGNPYRAAPGVGGAPTGDIPDIISAQGFVPLKKVGTGTAARYCVIQNT
jgi:ABC-type phosphate transport system substrate-binding protein